MYDIPTSKFALVISSKLPSCLQNAYMKRIDTDYRNNVVSQTNHTIIVMLIKYPQLYSKNNEQITLLILGNANVSSKLQHILAISTNVIEFLAYESLTV